MKREKNKIAVKPENQMVYMHTFIVTNMYSSPEYLIKFYCKRGLMENFIKESESGFDFASVQSYPNCKCQQTSSTRSGV